MKKKNFEHKITMTLHYNKGSKVADSIEVEANKCNTTDFFLAATSLLERTHEKGLTTGFFARMFEGYAQLVEED